MDYSKVPQKLPQNWQSFYRLVVEANAEIMAARKAATEMEAKQAVKKS